VEVAHVAHVHPLAGLASGAPPASARAGSRIGTARLRKDGQQCIYFISEKPSNNMGAAHPEEVVAQQHEEETVHHADLGLTQRAPAAGEHRVEQLHLLPRAPQASAGARVSGHAAPLCLRGRLEAAGECDRTGAGQAWS